MKRARIAVLVSGGGTNLQALLNASARGELPSGEIAIVISNKPGAHALERAGLAGVRAETIDKRGCKSAGEFEERLASLLFSERIDIVVLAGFLTILSADFVKKFEGRMLNVHPSLIPSFCGKGYYGLAVHEAALARGVKVTGASVHIVNEEPDGGRILLQKAVSVLPEDTAETLQRRVMEEAEWVLLPKAVEMLCKEIIGGGTI